MLRVLRVLRVQGFARVLLESFELFVAGTRVLSLSTCQLPAVPCFAHSHADCV